MRIPLVRIRNGTETGLPQPRRWLGYILTAQEWFNSNSQEWLPIEESREELLRLPRKVDILIALWKRPRQVWQFDDNDDVIELYFFISGLPCSLSLSYCIDNLIMKMTMTSMTINQKYTFFFPSIRAEREAAAQGRSMENDQLTPEWFLTILDPM